MDDALKQAGELEKDEQEEQKLARDRAETISSKPSFRRKAKSPSPQKSKASGGGGLAASNAEINKQTLAVVTQMVKEGKVTAEEAKRHARALVSVEVTWGCFGCTHRRPRTRVIAVVAACRNVVYSA